MQIAYILLHKEVIKIMVKSANELPVVLSADHLMQLSGLSGPTIYKLLEKAERTKMFPVRRAGHKWLISRDGFLSWLNGQDEALGGEAD